jgi:hypothetical protein
MMTRPQLRRALFTGRSDTVVKRAIDRLVALGLLGAKRFSPTGYQVLWCTAKGRAFLVEGGAPAEELFAARGPVAAKDFQHTFRVVETAITLMEHGHAGDRLLFAWTLQRLMPTSLVAIPDILCLTGRGHDQASTAFAVEVDLGGESLSVIVAKTTRLAQWLASYGRDSTVAILILTLGARRRASMVAALQRASIAVPFAVGDLAIFSAPRADSASPNLTLACSGGERQHDPHDPASSASSPTPI